MLSKSKLKRAMSRARNQILTEDTWSKRTYWGRKPGVKQVRTREDVESCCAMGALGVAACELGYAEDAYSGVFEIERAFDEYISTTVTGDLVTFNDSYAVSAASVKERIKELEARLA